MSQSETTATGKFSLLPGSITRFFLLLIIVLLVTMGVMVQSAVNTWLKDRSYQIVDITHAVHKRIDTWRYATWQIYDNIAAAPGTSSGENLQETRLKQDVYYLEKTRRKTEALIFGSHDSATLEMTQRMSTYLDTLWGAETVPWSMYYLNGQDNSMILISTLPLKDLSSGFKESTIGSIVDSRRAEMLQQANALDERESFSSLRRLAWQNGHYFTLRTTFNQPGHLATVVAFDLPINDLIPPDMPLDSFRLEPDSSAQNLRASADKKEGPESATITFNGSKIEIASALNSTGMRLVWQVPFGTLLLDTLQNILLPLLLNIGLLALALFGYSTFRFQPGRQSESVSSSGSGNELRVLRALNEEIVSILPLGLLVHDQEANRTIMSNKIADHLLPHLNLQNITAMADQHQGVIQATINNELYEIRQFRSQVASRTQIFIIRDQDREVLVNKKLKQAQRLYEKNQQGRAVFMQNISDAFKRPLKALASQAANISTPESHQLATQADTLVRMVDEIQLANMLENDSWRGNPTLFSIQDLINEVVPEVLPVIKRKGLQLLINNHLPANDKRHGDRDALRRIVLMLIQYSVTTTQIGKITLEVSADESAQDRLTIRILDTGEGVTLSEVDNLHFPFLNDTQSDNYGKANPLTFWLCDQLARKLGGHLNIKARESLGTRYSLHVKMAATPEEEDEERLLDDVVIMVDVTSNEIRNIVVRQLENWGASCITPDDRLTSQEYDLFLTDNPSNLTASGLLLSDDESGVRKIGPGQMRVNFNMSNAMQEAVLQLIEEQLAQEEILESPLGGDENAELHASGYYSLFVDTVPDDVKRLYTESAAKDFAALAQTAHRLKGVFAMLNLVPGKQLCETLEHLIREKDASGTEKYISDIDAYVKSLL
ncbi:MULTISPECIES: phosphotransferase RcsD [Lelliottia]|jgi:two-component system sensor histidine kinase RcsD|uniref:Phosphotransferase RcsD n=1 Tax=Lelliottia nimipressuralis TaxID=69220 RepID=A0ABD4K8N6_9ENTR|nr:MULTISPECIES: phosphotransferase RcsD [Lelliottia]QMM53598.1 phosphotransferase RcsD [Enterobacter sp. RHB15-C17]AVY98340.1 phosphotransferase RcsD [Lelliottia sp. WB101]MBF4178313.1 phosphotransferase RcsD [Lelliottia nimipressuralis]MCD4561849.1 phosphotransferase RcsD [Lelliottia nimipressuralis]PLY45068.1 phosphotransferase RcsD [Lelliottia sp. F159]